MNIKKLAQNIVNNPSDFKAEQIEKYFEDYAELRLSAAISLLQSITKYEASIGGGCECCGSWLEHEANEYGDWIKVEDIEALIEQLRVNGL